MDAAADSGFVDAVEGWQKKYRSGELQRSVGFLMESDGKWVVLARDWCCERAGYRSWIDVPAGWVLEMKELGYAKESVMAKKAKKSKGKGRKGCK